MSDLLFSYEIKDWNSWSQVFCSIYEFTPVIMKIFESECLPYTTLENCRPGTNSVFKIGNCIIKIFVPSESGEDSLPDYNAELFAIERSNRLGVSVPKLLAKGEIHDRYLFRYLIMEYIDGGLLCDVKNMLNDEQKHDVGRQLRHIVNTWGTKCESFNGIDAISKGLQNKRWRDAPTELKRARRETLEDLRHEPNVFVHGDLTGDNLILNKANNLVVLDFADSQSAPSIFENMPIICDAFDFDRDFLQGYFGNVPDEELALICTSAILCHEFGYWTIRNLFGDVSNADDLRQRVFNRLKTT
jgi:fructosamine-3-kinase